MKDEAIKALAWMDGKLRFLDQTRLPGEEVYVETKDDRVVAAAIKSLAIRGAPLIGVAAAYGVALAAIQCREESPERITAHLEKSIHNLLATRPTAVNLAWALERTQQLIRKLDGKPLELIRESLLAEAQSIHREDYEMCERISELGVALLPNAAAILTHCNTGSLATGGKGTALGIIAMGWEKKIVKHVYVDETRPLLQGARLTMWELKKLGIPSTLIPDNTAAFLMQQKKVNAVIVGADRIAANGDVANKVGTYGLAVLAWHHRIPMIVAAPVSTIDHTLSDGKLIPIEQRSSREVTEFFGKSVTPPDVEVYSPAFDITPHELISAIVTDKGVLNPPYQQALEALRPS
ncbi:MAG: S-methyl-5-thioribose-1-phosphate isomerase [Bacteroidota bacterium]